MAIITYRCDGCRLPITESDGLIHLSYSELNQYREARAAWESRHPGNSINMGDRDRSPRRVQWKVHHDACAPGAGDDSYWIAVDRADTAEKLLDWSCHLSEMQWLGDTDWFKFVRGIALSGVDA